MIDALRVHLLRVPEDEHFAHLRELLEPGVEITSGEETPRPGRFEILVAGRPEREHLEASPNLRSIVIPWAGLSAKTRELLLEFPQLSVHNLHYNAAPVAEMAIALLLAAAKRIVPIDRELRADDWSSRYAESLSMMLEGKTAVVLGYGAIGRLVASLASGLGMDVVAVRRSAGGEQAERRREARPIANGGGPAEDPDERLRAIYRRDVVRSVDALEELLPEAEALLVCVPLTGETAGMIGEREIGLLPRNAIVVNVGRGEIINERALYEALRDHRIHSAGLDVWYRYPESEEARSATPPSSYPFRDLDNVVMSPHRASALGENESETRRVVALARLLNAAARGEAMPNRVDVKRGY